MKSNVKIETESVNQVKLAIVGTSFNIATFYAEAASEKIERDNLRTWIETPKQLSDRIDKNGGPY